MKNMITSAMASGALYRQDIAWLFNDANRSMVSLGVSANGTKLPLSQKPAPLA
jgi:hypothetical protein